MINRLKVLLAVVAMLVVLKSIMNSNRLSTCVIENDLIRLTNLVRWQPQLINSQGKYGWTPLMFAARDGNLPAFQHLMAYGADPDIRESKGFTVGERLSASGFGKAEVKGEMSRLVEEFRKAKTREQAEKKKPARKLHDAGSF